MIDKRFLLAGKAIFTVEPTPSFVAKHGCPPHYTYRVTHKPETAEYREGWFISLLNGPDNESDYIYLGKLVPASGKVRLTPKSKFTEASWPFRIVKQVLARLWAGEEEAIEAAGWKVHHEARCGGCGRLLTDPRSIETGLGPECARRSTVPAGA